MKVLGRAAASARSDLTDGSIRSAWHRAALVATIASALVFGVLIADSQADPTPFNPTVTFTTSTKQAAAHPDARITVENQSDENLKAVTMDLPDGLWGSLNAATQCAYATAAAGNCTSASQVGAVTAQARVDNSDVVLHGAVYLTKPHPDFASTDPAWLSIKITPTVGGVTSFPAVITPARVTARYALAAPNYGPALGIRTQIGNIAGHPEFNVPTEVTDTNNRTIQFSLRKVVVDLRSDQISPRSPLLTNPSNCGPGKNFVASFEGSLGTTPTATSISYQATGCDQVKFRPAKADFDLSNPAAWDGVTGDASVTGLNGTIEFPEGSSSLSAMTVRLPAGLTFYAAAYGSDGGNPGTCNPSTVAAAAAANQYFNPKLATPATGCYAQARVGTAKIYTPLLPDPLDADVYLVSNGSTPHLGIIADSTTGVNNPAGITISAVARNTAPFGGICASADICPYVDSSLVSKITGLPDAPVSKIELSVDMTDAERAGNLPGKIMSVVPRYDAACQPVLATSSEFTSQSGATAYRTHQQALTGCDAKPMTIGLSPAAGDANVNLTNGSPAIPFSPTPFYCAYDTEGSAMNSLTETCDSPASPGSALTPGIHAFGLADNDDTGAVAWRTFNVQSPASPQESDTTPPTVSIDTPVADPTSDTTPSIDFSATGGSTEFQCSLNGGAFLPCGTGSSGTYTVPTDQALIPRSAPYSIAVRAQDAAGNVSSAQTSTFEVDVPLDPTFLVDNITNTGARQHPEMDVTITSGSHEDIKDLKLSLPDGFLGGLTGVQSLCPINTANAGACTSASEVGTVEAEAVVDESTIRLPGKVYMTDPIGAGDPAGLYVDIPAKLQDVDMGHVLVPIRLSVRGQVEGIDSIASNVPNEINPTNGIDGPTDFDMRSIKLKLRNNPSAPQPLLTNPSQCNAGSFGVSFTGYGNTEVSKSQAYQATNCGALGFAPSLSMTLLDTKTGKPPVESTPANYVSASLTADLTMDPNNAGIKSAEVLLPKPVTVNVQQLPAACTVAQYQTGGAEGCPATTLVGSVSASSPLLLKPLEGKVYLLKSSDPSITLPQLLLALRGPINTDIIGTMRFVNGSQIKTTFASLPDAPISSFHLSVDKVISTQSDACAYTDAQSIATTTFGAYNGAAAAAAQGLPVTCGGTGTGKFKNKGSKSTMSLNLRAPTGTKFKSLTIALPKGLKYTKKGFKKGLKLKSGSRKLKYSCAKASKPNKLTFGLCKKSNQNVSLNFAKGTLSATKKVKKPKITVTAKDSMGRTYTFVVQTK